MCREGKENRYEKEQKRKFEKSRTPTPFNRCFCRPFTSCSSSHPSVPSVYSSKKNIFVSIYCTLEKNVDSANRMLYIFWC